MKRICVLILILIACGVGSARLSAADETPQDYCARIGNDDTVRRSPESLAGPIHELFGISGKYALETTYYRCAGGHLLLCFVGANLSCSKADTRTSLPAADEWCQANPNSDFIPMVVTGHDTAYAWRCVGKVAEPGEKIGPLDERGFFADNWKELK